VPWVKASREIFLAAEMTDDSALEGHRLRIQIQGGGGLEMMTFRVGLGPETASATGNDIKLID
jgi:hypothetical protein